MHFFLLVVDELASFQTPLLIWRCQYVLLYARWLADSDPLLASHLKKVEYMPEGGGIEVRIAYACQVQERYKLLYARWHAAVRKVSTGVGTKDTYLSKRSQ